jgi:hypothetical protein
MAQIRPDCGNNMADPIYSESNIRYLVNEIAKDIIEIDDILSHINMSKKDYLEISTTRYFKDALSIAMTEWSGATNTPKRVKLKAAAIAEELIFSVFQSTKGEALGGKVKALEVISKIAGLGALEPAVNANGGVMGNSFNLQINFSSPDGKSQTENFQLGSTITADYSESEDEDNSQELSEVDEDDTSTSTSFDSPTSISPVFASTLSDEVFDEL